MVQCYILSNALIICQIQLSAWNLNAESWQHLFPVEPANPQLFSFHQFPKSNILVNSNQNMQFVIHELPNQNQFPRELQHLEFQKKASPYSLIYLSAIYIKRYADVIDPGIPINPSCICPIEFFFDTIIGP